MKSTRLTYRIALNSDSCIVLLRHTVHAARARGTTDYEDAVHLACRDKWPQTAILWTRMDTQKSVEANNSI